ncbi:hypothetical protein [Acinetobacter sp. ANC 3813]|uniref:hypothetical protein n=1 Tax=Acinetobacter sp. ANC 3813 TaxID=1977873 RepID=UPI000A3395C2|nr:hypothetical protein [Acinetobacter sp. ANC 3813]OTG92206.1 hypothetical protein B9T34_02420 [Acinetobacter sp. ANC 3813]
MTLLEILDTSVKIGLGALITGIFAYFNQKVNISASVTKENLLYNRNLLTNISKDVEEINHLILKMWAIFEFETKQTPIYKNKILDRLDPLRISLFNDFNLLSKNEGLLLLHGFTQQQENLRAYGELLGKFNSYTLFRNGAIDIETTKQYRTEILETRKGLYNSLNKAIPK